MRVNLIELFLITCLLGTIATKEPRLHSLKEIFSYKMVDYKNTRTEETKYILFFSSLWSYKNWRMSAETIDKNSPELVNCSFSNCVFTNDKNLLKIHDYDALFFHQSSNAWKKESLQSIIETRSPHQLYVIAAQE